ncbi:MAG: tetratricopeptide repeat protein [Treponemataceae bacterium]|nr:tetratricopeptide repeat protein [Treponemataceae bacterium]
MKKIVSTVVFLLIFAAAFAVEMQDFVTVEDRPMVSPTDSAEAVYCYNKGTECLQNNLLEDAETLLLRAIQLDPEFSDAMDHLGLVYRRLGRYEEAIGLYEKSLSVNPENSVAYINMGIAYRLLGRYEDSRIAYLNAMNLDPEDPEPYYGIGGLYYLAGMYEACLPYYYVAIEKYGDSLFVYDACYYLASAYYKLEQYNEALQFYYLASLYYDTDEIILGRIAELEALLETDSYAYWE